MFGSGGAGGFGASSGNPFGHNQGSTAAAAPASSFNPFQASNGASGVKTAFGQSSGFGGQPPLPPGGIAGAPSPSPGGFGGSGGSGNPFGQKKASSSDGTGTRHNSTSFGTTAFGQNGMPVTSASASTRTTFGSAASGAYQDKAPAFGSNATAFGGSKTTFGGNNAVFGGNGATSAPSTSFGALNSSGVRGGKRDKAQFARNDSGYGFGSEAATPSTTFGSQSSGGRSIKKKVSPSSAGPMRAGNPFGGNSGGYQGGSINTHFGSGTSDYDAHPPAFGKPARKSPGGPTTTFGGHSHSQRQQQQTTPQFGSEAPATSFGGHDKRQQTTPKFGVSPSSSNFAEPAKLEARMGGGSKKSPFGKGKRAQSFGTSTEQSTVAFNGQQNAPRVNRKFPAEGGDAGTAKAAPAHSPMNGSLGKNRQQRPKKKAQHASEDDVGSTYTPSGSVSNHEESHKAALAAATNLDGLCADMCSPTERELHIRVDELSVFEKCFPDRPGCEQELIIKRFQRSSADHKLDIPEEIRPPGVLRRTQLYIEQEIMDREKFGEDPRFNPPRVPDLIDLYNFCWDRFRMIRKDFVLQNYRGAGGRVHPIALDVHERIARYHVLSEHELIETPSFVAQQNMEQLGQTLKSLNELYDETHNLRNPAYRSPFEAECRAYFILCTLDNGRGMDVLKFVKGLPHDIMESPHVKFAMRVFVARHTGDFHKFFSLLREATYLQACLVFRYLPNVRSSALLRMNRAYRGQLYPLEDIVKLLCFDDMDHAYEVCSQHGLRISERPGGGDDSAIVVKFGGDFETDVQLRRNKTPLEVRGSRLYVGAKQGNYLRRDICRGVTEYAPQDYPALSKEIEVYEMAERAKLYPSRPVYVDDYSYFVDFSSDMPLGPSTGSSAGLPNAAPPAFHSFDGASVIHAPQHQSGVAEEKAHELELIAKKRAELERKKQEYMQRYQELQRAKEEKVRLQREKKEEEELAAKHEEELKAKAAAKARAEKEAEESKRQQQELEDQLREQKKQREKEEQRKRAEEAERERVAAQRRAEELRLKAAEEERRRQEEKVREEARRKATEALERQRQQELAAERERKRLAAELEAKRQAQLAKEREERKRVRRVEKQRLAILKLKLHRWKKYVQESRRSPVPIAIDATKLRLDRSHHNPKDTMQWLFKGATGASIGAKRSKRLERTAVSSGVEEHPSAAQQESLWSASDVVGLIGGSLRQQNPGMLSIAWKMVIANLLEDKTSSFGAWCAVKAGIHEANDDSCDCHRVFQSDSTSQAQSIAVCCRYLDSTFCHKNDQGQQREKLTATSAILLPVDLNALQGMGVCERLEQRLTTMLAALPVGSRAALFVLAFAPVNTQASRSSLLAVLKKSVRRVQTSHSYHLKRLEFDSVLEGDSVPQKFEQVLVKMAALSPAQRQLKSVTLKELLEANLWAGMSPYESSVGMQRALGGQFKRVREDIAAVSELTGSYIAPELAYAVVEPPPGWNSQEKQHEIGIVLTALEVTAIAVDAHTLAVERQQFCDVYFHKVVNFIDQLFRSYPASTAVSTYELKKRVYGILLPIHEQLTKTSGDAGGQEKQYVKPEEAEALLPWRKILDEIYGAFFETLNDVSIYYPADWIAPQANAFAIALVGVRSVSIREPAPVGGQGVKLGRHSSKAGVASAKPVTVSLTSLKRSFSTNRSGKSILSAVDESLQESRASGEVKRLCVEIAKERAATSQFQRMLRQALGRWDEE